MSSIRHMPVPTQRTAPSHDRYLDAAHAAILAVGWSRTTLTGIARRAGVSRMTLYRRWPDTHALLSDLMAREWGRLVTRVLATTPREGAASDGVADVVVACVAELRADPLLRRVVEVDPEVLLPYLLQRRGRSQDQAAAAFAELIAVGQAAGEVRAGDPQRLARSLLLAAQGFLLSVGTMTDSPTREAVASYDEELRQLAARYLAA